MVRNEQQHILEWLHQVVDPHQPLPSPSRKRRRQSPSPSSPPPNPKRYRSRLPTPDMSTSTPSKRRAPYGEDEDETPRAPQSKRSRGGTPSLPSRSSTTTTTGSSARSPVKSMIEMSISEGNKAMHLKTIKGSEVAVLGADAVELLSKLPGPRSIQGLVPTQLKDHAIAKEHFESLGIDADIYTAKDHDRHVVQGEIDRVLEIFEASEALLDEDGTEACWNEMVHYPVLQAALRGINGISWRNVTRAAVFPKELASTLSINPQHPSSMADYAIVLDLPGQRNWPRLWDALLRQNPPNLKPTFNATSLEYLCRRPIAVSIETKSATATSKSRADAQVFSCTSLQIARFRQLAQGKAPVPTLPAIVVTGTEWRLYFVTNNPDTNKFQMYGPREIGGTKDLLEVYRLLKSLRATANWSTSVLLPWWEKVLLSDPEPIQ